MAHTPDESLAWVSFASSSFVDAKMQWVACWIFLVSNVVKRSDKITDPYNLLYTFTSGPEEELRTLKVVRGVLMQEGEL
jgi:hypothetical protein